MPNPVSFQVLLGSSHWDAVRYCRALTEDLYPPYLVPDESYMAFAEEVAEDFSRWVTLDYWVGNLNQATSPMVTVANQIAYVCNVANGFAAAPSRITEFMYRATSAFGAASEISYLSLLPYSPLNRFLFTPSLLDSPSERILRDQYLSELDHYGRGFYAVQRDPVTGLLSVAVYPIPTASGVPMFAHYQADHAATVAPDGISLIYATVPETNKRHFARLLYCMVLEQEQERAAKASETQAGILRGRADPGALAAKIDRIRQDTYLQLGAAVPVAVHTF